MTGREIVSYERRYHVHTSRLEDCGEFASADEALERAAVLLKSGKRAVLFHLDQPVKP